MIRLVTIDLDGTLFDSVKNISEDNKKAIKLAKEKGAYVVIATGRPISGVTPVLEELGLTSDNDYVITYNGAKVYNVKTKELIFSSTITGRDVKDLYYEALRLDIDFHAFRKNEELITIKQNPYTDVECRINHVEAHDFNFPDLKDDEEFLKAMMVGEDEKITTTIPLVNKRFSEEFSMVRSSKIFLEFLNKSTNKGHALNALRSYLGLSKEETMAIGDAGNDLPMIEEAHIGVAMANAFPDIKERADYITTSNEESGVARAIEKFILN